MATEFPDIHLDRAFTTARLLGVRELLYGVPDWDLLRADNVLPESLVSAVLEMSGAYRQHAGWRYLVSMEDGFDAWVAGLGRSTRSHVRRTLRIVESRGVRLRWYALDRLPEDGLGCLVNLHTRRWHHRGDSGVFASPRFTAFHRELLRDPDSGARIARLETDQGPLACWYGFDHRGTRYFYQSGWRQSVDSFSPGIALHLMVMRDALARGITRYDFMKAGETSWKRHFATERAPVYHYALPAPHLRGRLLGLALRASPHWKSCVETG